MKTVRRTLALLGLGAIAATAFAPAAMADVFKDSTGAVYITGRTPTSKIQVTYNDVPRSRSVSANGCGLLVVRPSTSLPISATIRVNSTDITVASLTTETIPRCTGSTLEVPRTTNFKAGDGSVVIVGLTPNTAYSVGYNGVGSVRNATANACGFSKLSSNSRYPSTGTIAIGSTSYNLATVPTQAPPLCRSGVLYTPASSTSPSP